MAFFPCGGCGGFGGFGGGLSTPVSVPGGGLSTPVSVPGVPGWSNAIPHGTDCSKHVTGTPALVLGAGLSTPVTVPVSVSGGGTPKPTPGG